MSGFADAAKELIDKETKTAESQQFFNSDEDDVVNVSITHSELRKDVDAYGNDSSAVDGSTPSYSLFPVTDVRLEAQSLKELVNAVTIPEIV